MLAPGVAPTAGRPTAWSLECEKIREIQIQL